MRGLPTLLLSLALLTGPASAGQPALLDLADARFNGSVTVQILADDGDNVLQQTSGEGETRLFLAPDGHLVLEGAARLEGQEALRFDHTLREQEDGSWLDESDDTRMEITPSGMITVAARNGESDIEAQGTISTTAFQLQMRILANASQPEMIFDFDLVKEGPEPEAGQSRDCAQTVWQQRFVANPYGSTMSTVMVPVCIPARQQ